MSHLSYQELILIENKKLHITAPNMDRRRLSELYLYCYSVLGHLRRMCPLPGDGGGETGRHIPAPRRPDVTEPKGKLLYPAAAPRRPLFEVGRQRLQPGVPDGVEIELKTQQPVGGRRSQRLQQGPSSDSRELFEEWQIKFGQPLPTLTKTISKFKMFLYKHILYIHTQYGKCFVCGSNRPIAG